MRVFLWLKEQPCRRRRKINDKKRSWQAAASLPNIHHELLEARKRTLRAELSSSGRRLAARREGVCLCKVPRSASTQQHCQHPAALPAPSSTASTQQHAVRAGAIAEHCVQAAGTAQPAPHKVPAAPCSAAPLHSSGSDAGRIRKHLLSI